MPGAELAAGHPSRNTIEGMHRSSLVWSARDVAWTHSAPKRLGALLQASFLQNAHVMSSHCSGCGTAEISMSFLRAAAHAHAHALGFHMPIRVLHCCVATLSAKAMTETGF